MLGAARGSMQGRRRTLSAWDPSSISAIVAWYRADLGVTESGGLVSAWADPIGSNDLAQGNRTYQPTLVSSDANFNSQATLSFSGDVIYSAASCGGTSRTARASRRSSCGGQRASRRPLTR